MGWAKPDTITNFNYIYENFNLAQNMGRNGW